MSATKKKAAKTTKKKRPADTGKQQKKAEREGRLLLHEKLEALLDCDDEIANSLKFMIDAGYKVAAKNGTIRPGVSS